MLVMGMAVSMVKIMAMAVMISVAVTVVKIVAVSVMIVAVSMVVLMIMFFLPSVRMPVHMAMLYFNTSVVIIIQSIYRCKEENK